MEDIDLKTYRRFFEDGSLASIQKIAETYRNATLNGTVSAGDGGMSAPSPADFTHYFRVGHDAVELVLKAMLAASKTEVRRILDFPCGYGRVARHFVAAFPDAELTACDIEQDMIDFCAKEFGATPVLSRNSLADVHFTGSFDLIWCGSLLTHLPERKFEDALRLFSRSLAPGGIALVTTHGRYSSWLGRNNYIVGERFLEAERGYHKSGFGYVDYSTTPSALTQNYGITLSSPSYTMQCLGEDLSVRFVSYTERGWSNHQDVLVFKKTPVMS